MKRERINFHKVASSESATVATVYIKHKAMEHHCSDEHMKELLGCYKYKITNRDITEHPKGYNIAIRIFGIAKVYYYSYNEVMTHGGIDFFKSVSISFEEVW